MAIIIPKPGEALPKGEKRANETITFILDLNNILEATEVAVKIVTVDSKVELSLVRTRKGKFIEFLALPSDNGASQFLDYPINILFQTSLGNLRSASLIMRVYK
jgi:hypothetical protein